jgi:ubiquinol-cytochrome c reductase cytochrome b subunit
MLRAVPSFLETQVWGVIVMACSVLIFFALPWLDRGAAKSIRYRGWWFKLPLAIFVITFLVLGWLGTIPTDALGKVGTMELATLLARIFTVLYFLFFVLMPWYTKRDKTKPEPDRTTG